jgi:hypothetical protein
MSEEALPPTTLARMSAVLCMAPLLGLVLTVWGIVRHFQAISGAAYEGDPGVAQQEVGGYLVYMGVGVVLALVGFPLSPPLVARDCGGVRWLPACLVRAARHVDLPAPADCGGLSWH